MGAVSLLALAFYLPVRSRRLSVAALAFAAGAACVVALEAGQWKPQEEFAVRGTTTLRCAENRAACVHPAYSAALPGLTKQTDTMQRRLEQVGLGPVAAEQTPYAYDNPTNPDAIPVDVFSSAAVDLRTSLYEGVSVYIHDQCTGAKGQPAVADALAQWLAAGGNLTALVTGARSAVDAAPDTSDAAVSTGPPEARASQASNQRVTLRNVRTVLGCA